MRLIQVLILIMCTVGSLPAEDAAPGPTNEKAQKTYNNALQYLHDRMSRAALDEFKKADKQDDGHCVACQNKDARGCDRFPGLENRRDGR
jgi:hypothetical protein